MDIFKNLQSLKAIEPRKDFTIKSRSLILGEDRPMVATIWGIILKNVEMGASLALVGLLIFMILGGFSAWNFFAPLRISNLDPASLKAEAQAVDIQIQLTNLNYAEAAALPTKISESTVPAQAPASKDQKRTKSGEESVPFENSTAPVSIDEVLQELSN